MPKARCLAAFKHGDITIPAGVAFEADDATLADLVARGEADPNAKAVEYAETEHGPAIRLATAEEPQPEPDPRKAAPKKPGAK